MSETDLMSRPKIGGVEVMTVKDIVPTVNMLIYGRPGVGKTVLAGSASVVDNMSPVLFIDIEGGTLSLKQLYPLVEVVRIQSWRDMTKLFNALAKGDSGYQTVVLDSLSEIQKYSMGVIMSDVVRDDPTRDSEIPSVREWGKNLEQIRRLVRSFRDLPMNVIFTALDANEKDDRGRMSTGVNLPGKLGGEVPGYVDIVMYMSVKRKSDDQVRVLQTVSTDRVLAKDRSNKLPPVIENPTMETIYSLINQEGNQ